jgi:argininosuccinate lyase
VRIEGLSFRQAHEIAAEVARSVVAMRGSLEEDGYQPFVAAFRKIANRASTVGREQFAEIVSAEHFIAVRDRPGGPAPRPLDEALAGYRLQLRGLRDAALAAAARESAAADELAESFRLLVEQP